MRIDRPQLPTSKLLCTAVRGNKNGYYKSNDDADYGDLPSSPSKSRRTADVRRPLLLDVKELEHSKHVDCDMKKSKMKKVVVKKISPPSPSQRSIKRGVVARRIDAIENGHECDDDVDDDDASRYLLSSVKSPNGKSLHQPKKSLLGFRLGSPRNIETGSSTMIGPDSAGKFFSSKRILEQNYYRDMDEKNYIATEVVDLGGFDILDEAKKQEDDNKDEVVASFSSDKENDDKSLTRLYSAIDPDGHAIEGTAKGSPYCEVDIADADTILADLADIAVSNPTGTATDTSPTPCNNANLVDSGKSHIPIDASVAMTTPSEVMQPSSCVSCTTTYSNYIGAINQEKPFHITVTPTEDGDVILLSTSTVPASPHTAAMDSAPQNESKLLIPSLRGGNDEGDEADSDDEIEKVVHKEDNDKRGEEVPTNVNITPVEPEYRKKMVSFSNNETETSSPTGVDELDVYEEVEISAQEIRGSTSDDFIANEGWEDEEDDTNTLSSSFSRPFGSFEVHEDAMRDIRKLSTVQEVQPQHDQEYLHLQQHHVIQLRHSMESDCDDESQSSSSHLDGADLLRSDTQSVELEQLAEEGKEEVDKEEEKAEKGEEGGTFRSPFIANVDTGCNDSSAKDTTLGSFSQIYMREGRIPDDEESDSECDESAECFGRNDTEFPPETAILMGATSAEISGDPNEDVIEQTSLRHLGGCKPWALAECDSESVYSGDDLISVPSKMSSPSSNDQEILALSSSILSADPHSVSTGDRDHENFETLNTFWVREWTEAVTKLTSEYEAENEPSDTISYKEGSCDHVNREPRLLLKKDVGDTMSDNDNESDTGANINICTDGEGNRYLKIYDIDSCTNVYEVIQLSHELETVVEECSSEEDVEAEECVVSSDKHRGEKSLLLERLLEDTVETEMQKLAVPQHKEHQTAAPTLEELQRLFDEYQATQCNQLIARKTPPLPSTLTSLRSAKSIKKRHIHVKRRAIVKAKTEKTKYDLVYVEKGSHRDKTLLRTELSKEIADQSESYSNASYSTLGSSRSLDGIISKAMITEPEFSCKAEDRKLQIHCGVTTTEEDQSDGKQILTIEEESYLASGESFEYCEAPVGCNALEMEEQKSGIKFMHSIEEDNSLGLGSNMSLDGIISKAIRTMPEFIFEDKDCEVPVDWDVPKMELGDAIEEEHSLASSVSLDTFTSEANEQIANNSDHETKSEIGTTEDQPGANEGSASILAKLYDENNELAESLAAVQRELENVNRKLAVVTHERDEVISSARIEV
jgi:hypothetical protein